MLTDKQVFALTHILVENNATLTKISYSSGWYGAGNTNTSAGENSYGERDVAEFSGKPVIIAQPIRDTYMKIGIAAIVEDVVYLIIEKENWRREIVREVKHLHLFEVFSVRGSGPAYDTWESYSITPISEVVERITTDIGEYVGTVVKGLPEGKGKYVYNDKDPLKRVSCEGFFVAGKMERFCTVVLENGCKYVGWTQNDTFSSDGMTVKFYYPNGEYYEGEFLNGKMHGSGYIHYSNGKIKHFADWKNGTIVKYFIKDGERQ